MAYTKQTWADGEAGGTPVSPARLNHLEAGVKAAHDLAEAISGGDLAQATAAATPGTLARRDGSGRLAVVDGAAAWDAVNFGQLTAQNRDRGMGTALPASDNRRGDVYYHTGLGSLMIYTGNAWRQTESTVFLAEAGARDALSADWGGALHPGFRVFLTSDSTEWAWTGTGWAYLGGGLGEARYNLALNATVTPSGGGGTRVPLAAAELTHAYVTPAADSGYFTLNKAGIWEMTASVRYTGVAAGNTLIAYVGDDTGVTYAANGTSVGGAGSPDLNVSTGPKRFTAGQRIALWAFTNQAGPAALPSTAGNNVRTFMTLSWRRP